MAKKCCSYEPYEDGATGKSQHYKGFEDGSGRGKARAGGWSRQDAGGTTAKMKTRRKKGR
jgi:hypothetical protein